MDGITEKTYNFAKDVIKNREAEPEIMIGLTLEVMQSLRKSGLQGLQKKEVALDVLKLVVENDLDENQKTIANILMERQIPYLIDRFAEIGKGKYKFDAHRTCGMVLDFILVFAKSRKNKK